MNDLEFLFYGFLFRNIVPYHQSPRSLAPMLALMRALKSSGHFIDINKVGQGRVGYKIEEIYAYASNKQSINHAQLRIWTSSVT